MDTLRGDGLYENRLGVFSTMSSLLRSVHLVGGPALGAIVLVMVVSGTTPALAQETLPEVEVIGVTPMPGTGVARDRVPLTVQTITDDDIDALQPRNLTDLMEQTLRGVAATDVQNSPYQQNLTYRGFTLSPLLGEAQGLAVYMNGVRINEGFGDTMQWDLVPEAAIRRIDLVGGNPAYGLNALGGALSLQTHTGLSFSGSEFEIKGGSHGRLDTAVQAGGKLGATGVYVAAERGDEDGWRDNSDSNILRLYGDATHLFERGSLGISALFARTDITGNGATPEDLLEHRRASVFTYPDITQNDLGMFSMRGEYEVSETLRVSGLVYHRDLQRDTINGDEFDGGFSDEGYLLGGEVEDDDDDDDNGNGHVMNDHDDDDDDEDGEEEAKLLFGYIDGGDSTEPRPIWLKPDSPSEESAEEAAGDLEEVIPGARNLTSTDTNTQGLSLQADATFGAHQLAIGVAYDQSETEFEGRTLVGQLLPDRDVPELSIDGNSYVVTHECAEDEIDECDLDELEESEVAPLQVESETQAWGFYVSDTMALSDRTDLTLSGRYNHVEVDLRIFDHDDGQWERDPDAPFTYRRFNPAVGLTHRLTDGMSVYGGYREASRAPTAAELGCADPARPCRLPNAFVADPFLDQVVTRSVEAGVRGRASTGMGSVAWDVGTYASSNEDDILFVAVPDEDAQPGLGYFLNYGETRRIGLDGEIRGRLDRWDWSANYSFVRATFVDDSVLPGANHDFGEEVDDADCIAEDELAKFSEDADDDAKVICVEGGNRIPGVPEHTIKFGVGYTLDNGLRIGTTVVRRSGVYLRGDESNQLRETDGYSLVNLTLDWNFGALTLFGRVENLLGTDYNTFGILGECEQENGECEGEVPILELEEGRHFGHRFLSPGAPRSFFVGARYRF